MNERLKAWLSGELGDDDLTDAEWLELEDRVFNAVHKKKAASKEVSTFDVHDTVQ